MSYVVALFFRPTHFLTLRRWWWRRYARSSRFPNKTSPFVGFTEQLQSGQWMTGMALDAQHFGNHLELLTRLSENFETDPAPDLRQLSWKMNQRSFRADVLRGPFRDDVRAAWFVPLGLNFESCKVTWS